MPGAGGHSQQGTSLGIEAGAVWAEGVERVDRGEEAPSGTSRSASPARQTLDPPLREAMQLGHRHIGPEHLLTAVIRQIGSAASEVLVAAGQIWTR